ncbi:3-keto-5-aminohexanoate cleavage protein, partial [Methylobacterium sp. WL122]
MSQKTVITCALTGSFDTTAKNPAVPVSPEAIARSALEAAEAGAAVVHIHVRHPDTAAPSMEFDHYREVVERIRARNADVILNLTTGPGGRFVPGPVVRLRITSA